MLLNYKCLSDLKQQVLCDVFLKIPSSKKERLELLKALLNISHDRRYDIRVGALENLALFKSRAVIHRLEKALLSDASDIVRITAAEILGDLKIPSTKNSLVMAFQDSDYMVRGYAAISLSYYGPESIKILERRLHLEKSSWAMVCLYVGLYHLGRKEYLKPLLEKLNSKRYRVRILIVNLLTEIIKAEDIKVVEKKFRIALRKEKALSVKGSMRKSLEQLNIKLLGK